MSKKEQDNIRKAFMEHMNSRYRSWHISMYARNEMRYFDSQIEAEWQAFQAGFKFAKGEADG